MIYGFQEVLDRYPKNIAWELNSPHGAYDEPFLWRNKYESLCKGKNSLFMELSVHFVRFANDLLCDVLNQFPLTLHSADGVIHELPTVRPTGIRSALYYMLRSDYLKKREIKLCAGEIAGPTLFQMISVAFFAVRRV